MSENKIANFLTVIADTAKVGIASDSIDRCRLMILIISSRGN